MVKEAQERHNVKHYSAKSRMDGNMICMTAQMSSGGHRAKSRRKVRNMTGKMGITLTNYKKFLMVQNSTHLWYMMHSYERFKASFLKHSLVINVTPKPPPTLHNFLIRSFFVIARTLTIGASSAFKIQEPFFSWQTPNVLLFMLEKLEDHYISAPRGTGWICGIAIPARHHKRFSCGVNKGKTVSLSVEVPDPGRNI